MWRRGYDDIGKRLPSHAHRIRDNVFSGRIINASLSLHHDPEYSDSLELSSEAGQRYAAVGAELPLLMRAFLRRQF